MPHLSKLICIAAACLAVIHLTGCIEGYPHNLGPVTPVENMSQNQRLKALNDAGKRYYLGERWRYKLNKQCELRVTRGDWFTASHSDWIPLDKARVSRSFDRADKTYDVSLETPLANESRSAPSALIAGANWADSLHITAIAQHLQRDCSQNG